MSKKQSIFLADESLKFLNVLADRHDKEIGISSAVNLSVNLCAVLSQTKIRLTSGELLYCCDILNGGAHLTEFMPPDQANILQSLESMAFSLRDGINEPDIIEKWGIDLGIVDKINNLSLSELFALAIATRIFWLDDDYYPFKHPSNFDSWFDWARQFTAQRKCEKCGFTGIFIDNGETCPECKLVQ